ncbi:MAG TPA: hypothetical protein VMT64_11550 [Candidatus Binataceae bacterium]|nr:hypothetical protein [Candidatus Binataceae bacterium]
MFGKGGFADAGFAMDEEQSSAALAGFLQCVTQSGELVLASDENLEPRP